MIKAGLYIENTRGEKAFVGQKIIPTLKVYNWTSPGGGLLLSSIKQVNDEIEVIFNNFIHMTADNIEDFRFV